MKTRPYLFFLIISLAAHGLAAWATVSLAFDQPQFAVEQGLSGGEVSLVAGAPQATATAFPEEKIPEPDNSVQEAPVDSPLSQISEALPVREETESRSVVAKAVPSPKATVNDFAKNQAQGNSAVSADSVKSGGAVLSVKPDYLSNPPPLYPESARRKKQQGLVLLKVYINAGGRSEQVEVLNSCGYEILDKEAVRAVKNWRFRSAMLGGMAVQSVAEVPVRFKLE